ncbi:MAG: transporter permease [Desertimonas sp.]|nr:transporter permease [Desertimonas sp.]
MIVDERVDTGEPAVLSPLGVGPSPDDDHLPTSSPRRLVAYAVGVTAFAVVFVPMARDAGAGVWSGSIALGLAFALVAVGVYLTFRVLDFPDLTVDASFPAGAAIAALLLTDGHSAWWTLPAAFAVGSLFGALTGLLHIALRINSLLASILTVTAAFTINLRIQGSANVSLLGVDTMYTTFADPVRDTLESWFGATGLQIHRNVVTATVALVVLIVAIVLLDLFFRSEVGVGLRATGANRRMSRAQGIDTRVYLIGGVALSNALIAVSGALVAQHQGFADVSSGAGLIIAGLAAVIIGEVLFAGRSQAMWRHLVAASLGMVLYRSVIGVMLATDIDLPMVAAWRLEPTDVRLATAVVVALLLAVPRMRAMRSRTARR